MPYPSVPAPIKTALIGFGYSARTFHLPLLRALSQFKVSAVSTRQQEHLHRLDADCVQYSDAQQLIEQSDAELVIITSPNDTHYPLARQALERGKHVVIDKPFVCSSDEGEALIRLALQQNRLLSVYQNRRWDGDFLTLKTLIEAGRLGRVHGFQSHFDRFRPAPRERWREQPGRGTGIWFDLGPHMLDQSLQLFGLPQALSANLRTLRPGCQVVDYFHVQLHYPDLEVVLHCSPYCAAPNLRFQLEGERGSYRKFGLDPQEDQLLAGCGPGQAGWAREDKAGWGELADGQQIEAIETLVGGYERYYQQLALALREGGDNPVPPEQALQVMRLIELAELSQREQRRITLPGS